MSARVKRIQSFGRYALAGFCAAFFLAVPSVEAHLLNMSRIDVALDSGQRVQVTAELDLTRAFGSADAYFDAAQVERPLADPTIMAKLATAASAIELTAGEVRIELTATSIRFPANTRADYRSPLEWPRATVVFTGTLAADATPSNAGVRVRFADTFVFEEPLATTLRSSADGASKSRWLVTFQSSPVIQVPNWFAAKDLAPGAVTQVAATAVFTKYFSLGFWHILPDGLDHLLFVLALVLATRAPKSLLIVLSLYTLAHSLSFATAALGLLPPAASQVEHLIVASIIIAALMNFRASSASNHAPWLAFGFGLLHGLGFANALAGSGLPTEQRLMSLLGFNFGVESAQLLWVLVLLPMWWCHRYAWFDQRLRRPVSLGIVAMCGWWL